MSRKRKKQSGLPAEDRRAEAVTVAWMLCIVATVLSEGLGLIGHFLLRAAPDPKAVPLTIGILPGLMLFTALATGLVAVSLIPFVYRFRRTPPPLAITVFAIIAASVPLLIGLAGTLRA